MGVQRLPGALLHRCTRSRAGMAKGRRRRVVSSRLLARVGGEAGAGGRRAAQAQARLDALENDNAMAEAAEEMAGGAEDDEEYGATPEEIAEMGPCFTGRRRGGAPKPGKRQTRAARESRTRRTMSKSFSVLLEESGVGAAPAAGASAHDEIAARFNYLSAAAAPSRWTAARKFCSVCGFASTYTCVQCGARLCSRRCSATHAETRCLKFVVS